MKAEVLKPGAMPTPFNKRPKVVDATPAIVSKNTSIICPPVGEERFEPEVPLSLIRDAPDNPRGDVGDVTELASSIEQKGIIQPLLITPRGKHYLAVAGHRRKAASHVAGRTTVPCMIRQLTDPERIEIMLIENLQRVDLKPSEEARSFAQLAALGYSERGIADKIGKSQPHVHKRLTLAKLPPAAQAKIDSGGIRLEDVAELAKLLEHPKQLAEVVSHGGNVSWEVSQALKKIKRDEKTKKLKAELKRKGIRVLKNESSYYGFKPPEGAWAIGKQWGQLPIDGEAHALLACHAVGISAEGDVIPCCTDRENHPEVPTKGEAMRHDPAEVAQAQAVVAELKAAAQRRREMLPTVVDLMGSGDRFVLEMMLDGVREDLLTEVAELLDVAIEPMPEGFRYHAKQQRAAALQRKQLLDSARTGAAVSRMMWLIALLAREGEIERGDWRRAQPYFDVLTGMGHKPSPAELQRLQSPPDLEAEDELIELGTPIDGDDA